MRSISIEVSIGRKLDVEYVKTSLSGVSGRSSFCTLAFPFIIVAGSILRLNNGEKIFFVATADAVDYVVLYGPSLDNSLNFVTTV